MLNLAPAFISGHYYLGKALLAEGRAQEALTITQQEVDEGNRLNLLPIVLQAVGRKPDADEALHILSTKIADDGAFNVAMVYAYRGDREKALQWLDRAYRQKDLGLVEIVGEPLLKNLADDPHYKAVPRQDESARLAAASAAAINPPGSGRARRAAPAQSIRKPARSATDRQLSAQLRTHKAAESSPNSGRSRTPGLRARRSSWNRDRSLNALKFWRYAENGVGILSDDNLPSAVPLSATNTIIP